MQYFTRWPLTISLINITKTYCSLYPVCMCFKLIEYFINGMVKNIWMHTVLCVCLCVRERDWERGKTNNHYHPLMKPDNYECYLFSFLHIKWISSNNHDSYLIWVCKLHDIKSSKFFFQVFFLRFFTRNAICLIKYASWAGCRHWYTIKMNIGIILTDSSERAMSRWVYSSLLLFFLHCFVFWHFVAVMYAVINTYSPPTAFHF